MKGVLVVLLLQKSRLQFYMQKDSMYAFLSNNNLINFMNVF